MPHSDLSTRTADGYRACPYCGREIRSLPRARVNGEMRSVTPATCARCSDLPALEPLDDRYLVTETDPRV